MLLIIVSNMIVHVSAHMSLRHKIWFLAHSTTAAAGSLSDTTTAGFLLESTALRCLSRFLQELGSVKSCCGTCSWGDTRVIRLFFAAQQGNDKKTISSSSSSPPMVYLYSLSLSLFCLFVVVHWLISVVYSIYYWESYWMTLLKNYFLLSSSMIQHLELWLDFFCGDYFSRLQKHGVLPTTDLSPWQHDRGTTRLGSMRLTRTTCCTIQQQQQKATTTCQMYQSSCTR